MAGVFGATRVCAPATTASAHWAYFVDADEWVSPQLASEIAMRPTDTQCAGFAHRLRLVCMGTWIHHCGWYPGSWVVRLVDRLTPSTTGAR